MKNVFRLVFLFTLVSAVASCASLLHSEYSPLNKAANYYEYIQPSFSEYLAETRSWLLQNRSYVSNDTEKEIAMNMPFELSPKEPTKKAILLVHGLGDSPYSFSDLAISFQEQGFYVQTLLLPGHGSKPEDLMLPRYSDWQTIVDHYANLLKVDYREVWLGGFSTGGNLVTIHAIDHGGIDGLALISPGFQSKAPILEKFAPIASLFTDGYETREDNLAKYNSAPLNGAMAYSESAEIAREKLAQRRVIIPTMLVLGEADSVVDPFAVKEMFNQHFDNPKNKLIWYGESMVSEDSIEAKTMLIAEQKISTASHMSPLFSPDNTYYGVQGDKRMCMNSYSHDDLIRCRAGEEIWFSAWGYEEEGKIHARLTWNPYFNDLEETIRTITH